MRPALLLALLALPAFGDTVSGIVKDPAGATVAQAAVTLVSPEGSSSATTDPQGHFEFLDIPAGSYRLDVARDGFEPFSLAVTAGPDSPPIAIALKLATVRTTVQVFGGRSSLRNSDPNYQALRGGALRGLYRVKDLVLARDAATFTFRSGSFSFLPPVLGRVTAAVFLGDGNFQLKPAFEIATNHLKQISGAPAVDEDFTSLVVYFSDDTHKEILAHAEEADESPKAHQDALHHLQESLRRREDIPATYLERIIDADDVPNMEAEILAELYNQGDSKSGGSFRAFIHGHKHSGLRFILNPLGAMPQLPAPEEVALLNFDPSSDSDGIWYLAHTIAELKSNHASSGEDHRLVAPEHYRVETAIGRNLRLSVVCDLQMHSLREGVRAVKFDLLPDLQVSRLMLDGVEIPFVQESRKQDGSFYVFLPAALAKGRAAHLMFEYEGGEMIRDLGGKLFTILPRQPWYPRVGGVSRATWDMTFRTPRGMTVVATGDRVRAAAEQGLEVSQWVSKVALPAAGFNYGDFYTKQVADDMTGFPLEADLGESARGNVLPDPSLGLSRAENALRVYQYWFGSAPYSHLAVTESNITDSLPGLLFVPALAMTDAGERYAAVNSPPLGRGGRGGGGGGRGGGGGGPEPRITGPRFDEPVARETARQWWGNLMNPVSFHDEWLVRGLADFSASLYDMAAESESNDFLEHWRMSRDQLLVKTYWGVRRAEAAPIWLGSMAEPFLTERSVPGRFRRPFIAPSNWLTGAKGGYIIQMLRALMYDGATGDRDFIAMMHDFTATVAHQPVSTEVFKYIVEKHMKPSMDLDGNKRMDWFFAEWVYGTELPSYSLEYSMGKGEDGKPVLNGKLTQSGVSEAFRMRVPVYVKSGDKTIRIGAVGVPGNRTVEFRAALPPNAKKALLNANYDVLCAKSEAKEVKDVKQVRQSAP
jgi:hypothetical protein